MLKMSAIHQTYTVSGKKYTFVNQNWFTAYSQTQTRLPVVRDKSASVKNQD